MKTKNYRIKIIFCIILSIVLFGLTTLNAQISIIVSKSSSYTMTKDDLLDVFTGVKGVWDDGAKIQVLDQADSETGKVFYEKFINKTVNQVRLQWMKLVLSGQVLCPKKLENDLEVRRTVADDPNAIGYIKTSDLNDSVRELLRIE